MRTLRWRNRHNRNRRALPKSSQQGRLSLRPATVTFDTPDVVLTFSQAIVLSGIPQFETSTGKLPTAASCPDTHTLTLTYPTPGSPTGITVPASDPSVRAFNGAYVDAGTYTF